MDTPVAANVWKLATQSANKQRSPSDNHVNGKARQEAIDMFEKSRFYATPRLQRAEKYFDHPTNTVVLNHGPHLFEFVDR